MPEHVMFLSVPGLRPRDVGDAEHAPNLHRIATEGGCVELTPSFPCVTSPVQATMMTGTLPGEHGIIANGFYYRDRRQVEFWVAGNSGIQRPQVWDMLRERRPGLTSAVWHVQNIKDASADYIVTPAPIHKGDGSTELWCYSKPDRLYQKLLAELGHFPLQHYWGPLANIKSSEWTVEAALWLAEHHRPNFHYVYLQHLDYAAQKHGPDSEQALEALAELDALLGHFIERYNKLPQAEKTAWIIAGEYAMTDVTGAIYPNRLLHEAGLLATRPGDGGELLDLAASEAFAMVDHQFAHVFVRPGDDARVRRVAEVFGNVDGIAEVIVGDQAARIGMQHERSGEVILIADEDRWLAYYWWLDDAAAPAFARTVDIHRKPGYDPVELFFDPASRSIPLSAGLVKGSHGVPATGPQHRTALVTSHADLLEPLPTPARDLDVAHLLLRALGAT